MRAAPRKLLASGLVTGLFTVDRLAAPGLTGACFSLPPAGGSASVTLELGSKRVAAEVSVSGTSYSATGVEMVTVSVRLSTAEFAGLEAELGRLGFSVDIAAGGYVVVSYTVPVSGGSACIPDLLDPRSWPVGTAVLVETGVEGSSSSGVSYGGIELGASQSRSEGMAVAMVRVDADTTAVMVGTASGLGQALWIGVGLGPVALGLKGSREAKHNDFVYIELDDDGTRRVGQLSVDSFSDSLSAYLSLDGGKVSVEIDVTLGESSVEIERKTWVDGQPSTETFTIRNGQVVTETRSTDGVEQSVTARMPVDGDQLAFMLEVVDPALAACIDTEGDYYLSYTATPSEVATLGAWSRARRDDNHLWYGCSIGERVIDEQDTAWSFGFFVAYCNGAEVHVPLLLREYVEQTGQGVPGQVEVYDANGQKVGC